MIDTHCHIDDEQYAADVEAVIRRQQEAGVEAILVPGINVASLESVPRICAAYPGYLYPALGLHPEEVNAHWREDLAAIREAIYSFSEQHPDMPLVAIGEIGLDYHFSTDFKAEQQIVLREQCEWALELSLPVMIHARDAAEDTYTILKEYAARGLRGVLHCYSGSREMAENYIGMGWVLGIGGVITFKNCKLAETLVPSDPAKQPLPLESLVLETDAPYMAPVPHRGEPNESRFMSFVVDKLAAAYGVDRNTVISSTNRAAKHLFHIK